jgi:hypothetical protein
MLLSGPAHPAADDLALAPAGRIAQAQAGGFGAVGLPCAPGAGGGDDELPLEQFGPALRPWRRACVAGAGRAGAACIAACRFAYTVAMSKPKDPAAVKLGRKGGLKRMAMLTPQERTDLARRAALKRWRRAKAER